MEKRKTNPASGHVGPKPSAKRRTPETDERRFSYEDGNSPQGPPPGASGQHGPKQKAGGKFRQESKEARPSDRLRHDGDEAPPGGDSVHSSAEPGKKAARDGKRLNKSKLRAEKSSAKLTTAKDKLAAQKPAKPPGPVKTLAKRAGTGAWYYAHQKIHEVEHENVGVEAAHRTELAGETAVRGGTRFVKHRIRTHPARRVAKLEKKDIRARADFQFRQTAQEHPELKSNAVSRFAQKQRIKRQYQKQAREAAKQGAKAAQKTAVTTEKIARAVAGFVKRHPGGVLIALGVILLIVMLQACIASMGSIGNGLIGAVGGTTYLSSDSDIETVEANYTALESDLRAKMGRIESDYPGYDEYRYTVDEIGHDPYELASYLTTKYAAYTPAMVQAELQALIRQQYTLTTTRTVEVRYRTETRTGTYTTTDPDTGETQTHSYTYEVQVPYNYYILNVTLTNNTLGAVIAANLTAEEQERYAVYQRTQGNRPYLFAGNIYAHPTGEYTDYEIPPAALADQEFAALIAEAEKYLGYPYVWGGSKPATSFDCSGFVCWVLNNSGVYPMSRTTAQGIFNQTTPITPSEAKPGDIIFFTGTYDSPGPVSHVGIYVGDNMMIHCASGGVQYARMDTKYWKQHFYAFGRLNYD